MTAQQTGTAVHVAECGPDAAGDVLAVVHAGFGDRPVLDPPSTALEETLDSVAAALGRHGGLVASVDGRPVGALLLDRDGEFLALRRVSVRPEAQRRGVGHALVSAAEDVARRRGLASVSVGARAELPATIRFWQGIGYREVSRTGTMLRLARELPVGCEVPTAESMQALGDRLSRLLRAGDLLVLSGGLGAGKTTFAQGVGRGLGVRGEVTSPTFVISRVHPSLTGGPALVHVDAYRLGGLAELDDLDLDVSLEDSVTLVEWGEGLAEALAEDRLEVAITRRSGEGGDEARRVDLSPVGARWVGSGLARLVT